MIKLSRRMKYGQQVIPYDPEKLRKHGLRFLGGTRFSPGGKSFAFLKGKKAGRPQGAANFNSYFKIQMCVKALRQKCE